MTGKKFEAESTLEMIDGILRLRKQVDIQRRVKEEIQKIQRHRKICFHTTLVLTQPFQQRKCNR